MIKNKTKNSLCWLLNMIQHHFKKKKDTASQALYWITEQRSSLWSFGSTSEMKALRKNVSNTSNLHFKKEYIYSSHLNLAATVSASYSFLISVLLPTCHFNFYHLIKISVSIGASWKKIAKSKNIATTRLRRCAENSCTSPQKLYLKPIQPDAIFRNLVLCSNGYCFRFF